MLENIMNKKVAVMAGKVALGVGVVVGSVILFKKFTKGEVTSAPVDVVLDSANDLAEATEAAVRRFL